MRTASLERNTKETEISVEVNIDGSGKADISTGIGFLDHMLEQVARHSLIDIKLKAKGDLHVDQHHTVEDSGIALGQALTKALGDKKGITRFAVTRGANPIKVQDHGTAYEIPVPKVNAVDTLGAGDIFHGAFCWFILQKGENFQSALTKAVSVASLSCQFSGTREWALNLDEPGNN